MSRDLQKYSAWNCKILVILIPLAVVTNVHSLQSFCLPSQTVRTPTDLAWRVRLPSLGTMENQRGPSNLLRDTQVERGGTKAWSRGKVPGSDSSG